MRLRAPRMAMPAARAARAWRGPRSTRRAFRPVSMGWRHWRGGAGTARVEIMSRTQAIRADWMLRLHLHWTQAMHGGVACAASPVADECAASRASPVGLPAARAIVPMLCERLVQRVLRTSSSVATQSTILREATRVFRVAHRTVGARVDAPATPPPRGQTSAPATPMRFVLASRPRADAANDAPATTSVATKPRSPDLVWRKPPPPQAHAAIVESAAPSRTTWQATASTAQASLLDAPSPIRARLAQAPDGAAPDFVDRVANDVLRRIDHRLRIERERRGM